MKLRTFSFFILSILIAGCGSRNNDDRISVTVSIPPQQRLIESIAGDRVKVNCLMTADANPESFDPAMNSMIDLRKSDIYFPMGTLDFERTLLDRIGDGSPEIVNMSEGVDYLYGTHAHHHHDGDDHDGHEHHEAPDPHVWSSLRNMRVMAGNVADALIEIDNKNAEYYKSNLKKLTARIDSLDAVTTASLDTVKVKKFIVWHPSLSYFANDYGLKQITVGSHGKELSVKELVERIREAADTDSQCVFFFQKEFDSQSAAEINRQLGAKMVIINPMNPDWESEIMNLTDALRNYNTAD